MTDRAKAPLPKSSEPSRSTAVAAGYDWATSRGEKWRGQLAGMEATLAPIDAPLLRALQLDAPRRIADLGCGGGGTTLAIRRQAPVGSVVHGYDISPVLVDTARARARAEGDERAIAFEVADLATATPPGAPYDRLVSRLGIMFFDDPPAAFSNVAHWLAPGGRFAFAAWGLPADNPWQTTAREVVAEFAAVPRPDPEAPGPFRYGAADKLLAILARAGFSEIEVRDWRGPLPIGGALPAAAAADFALAAFSSFGELLAAAGGAALAGARSALAARFAQHEVDGAVRMDACVHVFTGTRSR